MYRSTLKIHLSGHYLKEALNKLMILELKILIAQSHDKIVKVSRQDIVKRP